MATDTLDHTTDHDTHHDGAADWNGGNEPWRASYGKLMMWYFLVSDAFTFAGFLIAYGTLRVMSPTWPVPDFVFSTAPFDNLGLGHGVPLPLIFVTFMSFLLILSSVTMVRAVQEGHRENKDGVAFWMFLTIIGGAGFLGCQAWEWSNLIWTENMTVTDNPFGTHTEKGVYLNADGTESTDVFKPGQGYLLHMAHSPAETTPGDYAGYSVDEGGFLLKKYKVTEGENAGKVMTESRGPRAFGGLFFFITGFHGFHVFSGVVFLIIIMLNVMSGVYVKRKNGYEMVEKIGLYWHFVDLVWVFVFLVFYLL